MRITLNGAAREVTGSCYHIQTGKTQILVDCGMFQGSSFAKAKNFEPLGFDPKKLDAVIVTHAHLDHTGRLPLLTKQGFKGTIYATPPTLELTRLILEDAEGIMDEEFRRSYTPKLFEKEDIDNIVKCFKAIDDTGAICFKNLDIQFHNAGHILGSASIRIQEINGRTAVFSGDLGNSNTPLLQPKDKLPECDALFIETTYGNRIHEDESTRSTKLKATIVDTVKRNGVLMIPSFAVERTQELLYELNHLVENRLMPAVDIFLDSPLAIEVDDVFEAHPDYYSREALRQMALGDKLFEFPGLHITATRDESKTINESKRPKVIIAGSGMMNGGRILHHLVRYLSDPKSSVLIIGFQAHGTLGQKLYSGEKHVQVLSEQIDVKAGVVSIGAYSAHADQKMLLNWISSAARPPKRTFCVHGEEAAAAAFATELTKRGMAAEVPRFGQMIATDDL